MSGFWHQFSPYVRPISAGVALTVFITFASFSLGALAGLPLALGRRSRFKLLSWPCLAYIEFFRAIPPLAWIFVIYFGVATEVVMMDALPAAILALGLITGAYMAEIYRAGLQSIPHGQWEAGRAIGLAERNLYRRIIARQAIVVVIPPAATYLISLLKDSSLASVIGVQEISGIAYGEAAQTFKGLEVFLVAAGFYLVLSIPLALIARSLDRTLRLHLRV